MPHGGRGAYRWRTNGASYALKYFPAIFFGLLAAGFFGFSFAGDNPDARALAMIFIYPAAIFATLAALCWLVAFVLRR